MDRDVGFFESFRRLPGRFDDGVTLERLRAGFFALDFDVRDVGNAGGETSTTKQLMRSRCSVGIVELSAL